MLHTGSLLLNGRVRDPDYGMYNCVNLCYCRVFFTELDSQIHWSSVPRRYKFISVRKIYKARFTKFQAIEQNTGEK